MAIDRSIDNLATRKAGMPKTTGTLEPQPGRCCAKLAYTGRGPNNPPRYCNTYPLHGAKHCRLHYRGDNVSGLVSMGGQFRTGVYSKARPPGLAQAYEKLLRDPDLLSLRHELALTRARLQKRMERFQELLGPAARDAIRDVLKEWKDFQQARKSGKKAAVVQAAGQLEKAMAVLADAYEPARREADAVAEIRSDTLVLEKLERSENLRVDELYNRITLDRALALRVAETTAFMDALNEFVPDRATQSAIRRFVSGRFFQLTGRRDDSAVDSRDGSDAAARLAEAGDGRGASSILPADVGAGVPSDPSVPGT